MVLCCHQVNGVKFDIASPNMSTVSHGQRTGFATDVYRPASGVRTNSFQQFLLLIQYSFLAQHMLEPTKGENVLDLVLSSQNKLVDNVKMHESLSNSDHNQIHFDIKVKLESINKQIQEKL